jgi:hypothetical protein
MLEQIKNLKKENQDLKDLLQDVAGGLVGKDPMNYGLMEKEIIAKVKSVVGGVKYNALDWDMSDRNGEQ